MSSPADSAPLRRLIYPLLILVAAGAVAGRILAVGRVYEPWLFRDPATPHDPRGPWPSTRPEPMPTLGDNDRSRWDTVRALVDDGTYAIGHRHQDAGSGSYHDTGLVTQDGWKTIDKVLRPDTHDFYSSKPPFLATLVAGEYWLLKHALGWSITTDRWSVVRTILLTVNGLPLVVYLLLLAGLVERFGTSDWGRLYVLAAGCFASYLTPFAITLNNHSVATCTALFALAPALRIWYDADRRAWLFALAGFFAAFTACTELPALLFTVVLFGLLLSRAPGRTLLFYAPAAAVPIAVFLLTNCLALGDVYPAYSKFGSPWYEYPGSYWRQPGPGEPPKQGIDWARLKEGKGAYAFHLLLGHHGLFSLTPMFLLALAGMIRFLIIDLRFWMGARAPPPPEPSADSSAERIVTPGVEFSGQPMVAGLTLLLAGVVVGFYIVKSDNYGGWTSGPRWLMWLTPFFLLTMLPIADRLAARRWGRGLAYLLLFFSVVSVSYSLRDPWRHPWLYNWLEAHGWIPY